MKILHRRIQTLVAKLFLRMVGPNVVRPIRRYPVADGVPRDIPVFGNRNVAVVNYPLKERVAGFGAVLSRLLG